MAKDYDLFIIGGGINGCGIARDAAGRGYSVFLCEMNDLASGTSSQSTKLIHGGLRYLEHYEFRLVREALTEREILWQQAPHIIRPLRFILPYHQQLRPAWLLRLGLFLYDHIGGRKKLPPTTSLNLKQDKEGEPLNPQYSKGFEYSDCAVDDARLVILNALDAAERGASIHTRSKCIDMQRKAGYWLLSVEDQVTKKQTKIKAKVLINASGPWADRVLTTLSTDKQGKNIRLVQGSHIIVPKLYSHNKCYIFQNKDQRIIFAIPYYEDFTLIGTTDQEYTGDPSKTKITQNEIDYLCLSANHYFKHKISAKDVISTFSGVRSLYNDGASKAQEATRDYVLRVDKENDTDATMINVFGGKITTYRRLAEAVMEKVATLMERKNRPQWTQTSPLPGGDFAINDFKKLCQQLNNQYRFLSPKEANYFIRQYGTRAKNILGKATSYQDLGQAFSQGLYQAEVEYLIQTEWALTAEDILWRRTKLGLYFTKQQQETLEKWLNSHPPLS